MPFDLQSLNGIHELIELFISEVMVQTFESETIQMGYESFQGLRFVKLKVAKRPEKINLLTEGQILGSDLVS